MSCFDKRFASFLRALEKHNDTAWFASHRADYEAAVKAPFAAFTRDMLERVGKVDRTLAIAPRDAMSRITRDTRFLADKRPYNTHLTCSLSRFGRANREYPATHLRLSAKGVVVFGGVHTASAATQARVRDLIAKEGRSLQRAVAARDFVRHFGELLGEERKRVPEDLREAVARRPLLGRRRWFFRAELPPSMLTEDALCDVLTEHWRAGRTVVAFLERAFV
ncbi:MAG: DUF2461 domain-containing protein [Planctomycetes bacterium]|nr:DUF2461 domain-containing protein [Planctomycetota bacterium]